MKILLASLVNNDPELNLLYACGEPNCHGMFVKEFDEDQSEDDIFNRLVCENYDCIFFTSFTRSIEKTKYLCENLKKALPKIRLVVIGAPIGYESRDFLEENPSIDAVIFGEGEYTFSLMCRALTKGEPTLPAIRGLAYRAAGHIYVNNPMPPVRLDSLPFVYEKLPANNREIICYETTRGCPYNCTYCAEGPLTNTRVLPVERVKEELAYLMYKKPMEIDFLDRVFNWDKDRANEILRYIIELDNGYTNFVFRIAGDNIDEEFMDIIENAREDLFRFRIDVQSQNSMTQKAVNRNGSANKELINARKLSELGLADIYIDIMVGLPFEDMDSFAKSFNSSYMTIAKNINLVFLKLERGSELRLNSTFYNYEYRSRHPYEFISNGFLSAKEVVRLKRFAKVLDLFYNKYGYQATLNGMIEASGKSPFDLYMEFGDFYHIKGYDDNHQEPYKIMKEYIEWKSKKINLPKARIMYYLNLDMKEKEKEGIWKENTQA